MRSLIDVHGGTIRPPERTLLRLRNRESDGISYSFCKTNVTDGAPIQATTRRGDMQIVTAPRRKILIMGLPGAGKTTLASILAPRLNAVMFNADEIRANIHKDLGFSVEDRIEHARRMGW